MVVLLVWRRVPLCRDSPKTDPRTKITPRSSNLRRRSPEGRYNWADYDEEGYWEFASLHNYLLYAGTNLAFVWGFGLWFWYCDRQAYALTQVCSFVAHAGIRPVFCM